PRRSLDPTSRPRRRSDRPRSSISPLCSETAWPQAVESQQSALLLGRQERIPAQPLPPGSRRHQPDASAPEQSDQHRSLGFLAWTVFLLCGAAVAAPALPIARLFGLAPA